MYVFIHFHIQTVFTPVETCCFVLGPQTLLLIFSSFLALATAFSASLGGKRVSFKRKIGASARELYETV